MVSRRPLVLSGGDLRELPVGDTILGAAGVSGVRLVSSNTTAMAGELLEVDASTGARTITPPASPVAGTSVTVVKLDASSNAITWAGATNSDPNATIVGQWTGATFLWDGTIWLVQSVNTSSPAALGSVGPVNVRDTQYGAIGDGVADDSVAFLAAINTGREVYVPAGDYKVSLALTDQNVHLTGPGRLVHQLGKSVIAVTRPTGADILVSSIASLQIGPNLPTGTATDATETNTALFVPSVAGVKNGDVFHLTSQNTYPFSANLAAIQGTSPTNVYQAGFVPVQGIGVTVAATATINVGDTVLGATSGASGVVASTITTATAGQNILTFASLSGGQFSNGETLTVGGATKATTVTNPYIVMSGRLTDTYTTDVRIRKISKSKFVINGLRVVADGDVDTVVGSANRVAAFPLLGVYNAQVTNFTIDSAWTRCWQLVGCYGGRFDVDIVKLPNRPNDNGYGYGVELMGASEGTTASVRGGNCRHAYTTNLSWNGYGAINWFWFGAPKYNTCRDSHIKNALTGSFDTHWGTYYQTFLNCVSINSAGTNRPVSESTGFHNRGFGTLFQGCSDYGSRVGFAEDSGNLPAGFNHIVRYRDCVSDGYQSIGLEMQDVTNDFTRVEVIDCDFRGDGSLINFPYYQTGVLVRGGQVTLRRVTSKRFNAAPFRLLGNSTSRLSLIDCTADYTEAGSSATGCRVDGAAGDPITAVNYRVRMGTGGLPPGVFRNNSGANTLNLDGYSIVGGTTTPTLALVTGGSLAITWKGTNLVQPPGVVGDTDITLTPRQSATVQLFNTPLTANRTVTLVTTTGAVIVGDTFRVSRSASATGSSTVSVLGSRLGIGDWVDVTYGPAGWQVTATGIAATASQRALVLSMIGA